MMFGYHGRVLRIDLNEGRGVWQPLAPALLRRFLGGVGLATYVLLEERQAAADPLSPPSPLVFAFSPLVGSPLTTSAKFAVVAKSPLTQRLNDSLVSSGFALAGKKCGADAIVLVGRAPRPSILVIDDDHVELRDAHALAGRTVSETETAVRAELGTGFSAAVIGPAGERGVRFATLSHDGRHAGRGGHGAVMGSKNLKAIAVRGSRRCAWAHPEALARYAKRISERSLGPETAKYRELGTVANLAAFNRLRTLPTRNFQSTTFERAEALASESLAVLRDARASCVACTIGCEHIFRTGPDANAPRVRMEYENLFALGPLCGVGDPSLVLRASQRCDELGIDTISTGGTIAFAMECVERGLLDAPWLRFGDGAAVLRAIELIAARKGLGERLSLGSRALAEELGPEAMSLSPHVKGLEIPGYDPRTLQTMALGFAVNTRGADHNRSGAYEADFSEEVDRFHISKEHARHAVASEDRSALIDSLILCKFLRGVFGDLFADAAEMLTLITGDAVTASELREVARRIVTARKLFNIRAGWTPAEDTLPARFFQAAADATSGVSRESFNEALRAYNQLRGWTSEGWIEPATLRSLHLDTF